jgi:nitroreductase/NAD-dependent dihydropyrimidine dehydrogenase PreA subunit
MGILGINEEKCIECKKCIIECPKLLFSESKTGKIEFQNQNCILCGHCIAICPTDAILREKMGDSGSVETLSKRKEDLPYNTLLKSLQAHRSIRHYQTTKISEEEIQKIFKVMQYAPSSSNGRQWRYRLISNQETITSLSQAITNEFIQSPTLGLIYGEGFRRKIALGIDPIFYHAPHVLLLYVMSDTGLEAQNAGIALTYARLAAESLGIGSCWIGYASLMCKYQKSIRKLAGVRGTTLGVITLGYPSVNYRQTTPRPEIKVKRTD